ncbi:MAG TPA: hypothetical protein PKW95_16595, partial [bacterium]|nr:hypothetical protein [bacterium]
TSPGFLLGTPLIEIALRNFKLLHYVKKDGVEVGNGDENRAFRRPSANQVRDDLICYRGQAVSTMPMRVCTPRPMDGAAFSSSIHDGENEGRRKPRFLSTVGKPSQRRLDLLPSDVVHAAPHGWGAIFDVDPRRRK